MMGERRDGQGRVGDTSADHHVRAGLKRRQQGIGAEIGVGADERQTDIAERARLVHHRRVRPDERRHVIPFDAGDLDARPVRLARDVDDALGRGARVGRAHIGDDPWCPASLQTGSNARIRRSSSAL